MDIIKYFGAFTIGYLILKSLISINHTISIEQIQCNYKKEFIGSGSWIFHIESVAKAAEGLTHLISSSAVGSATASASILLSAMMFHSLHAHGWLERSQRGC